MPTLYVETSALLRVALEGDVVLRRRLAEADRSLTSELTRLEADRALRRARAAERLIDDRQAQAKHWVDEFLARCNEIALDGSVLSRARRDFPVEPVRTLDALHLASLLAWNQADGRLTVVSCDERVRANALALGYDIAPD